MIDWQGVAEVEIDPLRLGGEPTFRGTRIPVRALFENLAGGATINEFVLWFPGTSVSQVQDVLCAVVDSLSTQAR
jgi:uncharacterized protein (DUF433 family)